MNDAASGERMRRAREEQGLRVTDIARATGLTRKVVWKLETGKSVDPQTVRLVSNALGLSASPRELVGAILLASDERDRRAARRRLRAQAA